MQHISVVRNAITMRGVMLPQDANKKFLLQVLNEEKQLFKSGDFKRLVPEEHSHVQMNKSNLHSTLLQANHNRLATLIPDDKFKGGPCYSIDTLNTLTADRLSQVLKYVSDNMQQETHKLRCDVVKQEIAQFTPECLLQQTVVAQSVLGKRTSAKRKNQKVNLIPSKRIRQDAARREVDHEDLSAQGIKKIYDAVVKGWQKPQSVKQYALVSEIGVEQNQVIIYIDIY